MVSPLSTKGSNYHYKWLRNRELGIKHSRGAMDKILNEMYSIIRPISKWESSVSANGAVPGSIFNLEFSPDGALMAAACEKKTILLFDANTQKHIQSVENAHNDCVNCIRFLDTRMFATCSDDSTVALWDTRNLKTRIRVLNGHSNWVKNVEYSKNDRLLVTSGFDGSIFTWDINSYTERGLLYKKVFHTNGLMRMKLHAEASKMVICTTGGYLMVIHDLDLESLPVDLHGFKPNMYRLMQISDTTIPLASKFTYLFNPHRKRNRLEMLTDFPCGDEAEVISSLQIHPEGWCALSRNISIDEHSEWTCVHDIQDHHANNENTTDYADYSENVEELDELERSRAQGSSGGPSTEEAPGVLSTDIWEALLSIHESRDRSHMLLGIHTLSPNNLMQHGVRIVRVSSGIEDQNSYDDEVDSVGDASMSTDGSESPQSPLEESRIELDQVAGTSERMGISSSASSVAGSLRSSPLNRERQTVIIIGPHNPNNAIQRIVKNKYSNQLPPNHKHRIHRNKSRLTHYIEETNDGKGFIKELGFSQDGRVICSPFSYGLRLLAFNDTCSELSSCIPSKSPISLHEIGTSTAHSDIVLCTKFSPRHYMLVSGCHSGNIIWYQPYL